MYAYKHLQNLCQNLCMSSYISLFILVYYISRVWVQITPSLYNLQEQLQLQLQFINSSVLYQ